MSRVIKFRAWDKINKWLDDEFYLGSDGSVYDIPNKTYNTPNTEIERIDNFILMQFTGLQDKNGKDIYEGDVISIDKNSAIGIDFNLGSVLTVGFFNGCFCGYIKKDNNIDARPMHMLRDIIVIGNIHENPELIQ